MATYNLLFNASLLVSEGLGYALGFDKLINTQGSNLCFRPLSPRLEARGFIVWKKYQVFSRAANIFLQYLRELLEAKKIINAIFILQDYNYFEGPDRTAAGYGRKREV